MPAPTDVWIAFGTGKVEWDETWPVGPTLDRIGPPSRAALENELVRFECDDTTPYGRFFQNAAFQYVPSGDPSAVAIELLGKLDFDEFNGSPIREFAVFENATIARDSGDMIHYELFPRIQKEEAIRYFHKIRMLFDALPDFWPAYDGYEYQTLGETPSESDSRYFLLGPVSDGVIVPPPTTAGDQGGKVVLLRSKQFNIANGLSGADLMARSLDSPLSARPENKIFIQTDFLIPFSWDLAGHDTNPLFIPLDGLNIGWSDTAAGGFGYSMVVNPKEGIFIDSVDLTQKISMPALGQWHRLRTELDISAGTANIFLDGVQEFSAASVSGRDGTGTPTALVAPEFYKAGIFDTPGLTQQEEEARESWTAYVDNVIVDVWT